MSNMMTLENILAILNKDDARFEIRNEETIGISTIWTKSSWRGFPHRHLFFLNGNLYIADNLNSSISEEKCIEIEKMAFNEGIKCFNYTDDWNKDFAKQIEDAEKYPLIEGRRQEVIFC